MHTDRETQKTIELDAAEDLAQQSMKLQVAKIILDACGAPDSPDAAAELADAGNSFVAALDNAIRKAPWIKNCRLGDGSTIWFRLALREYAEVGRDLASPGLRVDIDAHLAAIEDRARWATQFHLGRLLVEMDRTGGCVAAESSDGHIAAITQAIARAKSAAVADEASCVDTLTPLLTHDIPIQFAQRAVRSYVEWASR